MRSHVPVVIGVLLGGIAIIAAMATLQAHGVTLDGATLLAGTLGVLIIVFIGALAWNLRQIRRFNTDAKHSITASARGDHARAVSVLTPWTGRNPPIVAVTARHGLAWATMKAGQPRRAIELLAANEAVPRQLRGAGLDGTSALDLALNHALVGELAAAAAWLAESERRSSARVTHEAMKALARAVLDCRSDRHADVARHLDDLWSTYEAVAAGDILRPLRIVRAFAVAAEGPRAAGMAQRFLIDPAYPGEHDFLAVEWPEMGQFLAAHGLGGPAA